jgi:hypothetical protein
MIIILKVYVKMFYQLLLMNYQKLNYIMIRLYNKVMKVL